VNSLEGNSIVIHRRLGHGIHHRKRNGLERTAKTFVRHSKDGKMEIAYCPRKPICLRQPGRLRSTPVFADDTWHAWIRAEGHHAGWIRSIKWVPNGMRRNEIEAARHIAFAKNHQPHLRGSIQPTCRESRPGSDRPNQPIRRQASGGTHFLPWRNGRWRSGWLNDELNAMNRQESLGEGSTTKVRYERIWNKLKRALPARP